MSTELTSLDNGLRVVTERMPGLESASIGIWIRAGARHERAEQNGIAHFLEHMAFKGTSRRSARQIAEEIEDTGGYMNAYTSREMTAYYARVLRQDVPRAFDVLSDILLNPLFRDADIETERHVILQEIGQALDTPDDVIFDWLQEVAYPDQPLGRTILGPAKLVERFDAEDLRAFVAEHYGPDRMIVAAAGAVEHDQIVRLAEAAFGALAPRGGGEFDPARWGGGERREVKDLEQVHLTMAFPAPSVRDDDYYIAQVYATAMGGGMSSRLFQTIREERGLAYAIHAQAGSYEDTGMISIYAGTSGSEIAELSTLTMDELKRAADDMSEAEVARARAQLKAGLLMGLERPSARAERMARSLAIWGRVPDPAETAALIDAVGRDDVRRFAARLAETPNMAMALYGPADGAPHIDALRERLAA
ncbi:putative Zn-dependent peptidase [Albidovulum inexpectatum]|uniref:Putative Zn-dependent peptidase n=1 Tax=Albidovulum inexpectatum TaxID=196587 RepID=A0A2S5JI08_9RHOB|nr:pitrilysin family protein [Albidovulum inexpectatum]PPB81092.1 putative Zn-dependent peptidase [Albidovulum inexpectatum]